MFLNATIESQKPPIAIRLIILKNDFLKDLSSKGIKHFCVFPSNDVKRSSAIPPKRSLYIVAVNVGTYGKTGFIITVEIAVQINDKNAKMYPEILLLPQSSFTGKIIFDSPNKVVIMPMKVTVEGISFKIINERIPVTTSGPDKSMTDSTTGDNLLKEAKNRQSPNVIPIIPLVINTSKYCLSIINCV